MPRTGPQKNRISYERRTLGWAHEDSNHCNACGYVDDSFSHFRLNIDGIWHYLCLACVDDLRYMMDNPIPQVTQEHLGMHPTARRA